jgi:L-fuconolactonase
MSQGQGSIVEDSLIRIDSHQHFWKFDAGRHGWITDEMKILQQDFSPETLDPILKENKINGCVTVQVEQSENETQFLLTLANQIEFIKGVVGWIDLRADNINERLEYFARFKNLKGFRHIVQGEPNGFLAGNKFLHGISKLEKFAFTYDVLIYHHQLPEAIEFVRRFPNQKFVVDHLAKPDIKQNGFKEWSKGIRLLSEFENIACKLSGFTTEAAWKSWTPQDFTPYFDLILECFGSRRLLYGSDWPVCLLAASYDQQLRITESHISKLSAAEKQRIMGGNAIHFYNL